MDRIIVLQMIFDAIKGQKYLEIGVCERKTFDAMRAKKKIAVDPLRRLPPALPWLGFLNESFLGRGIRRIAGRLRGETFFQMSSRQFFKQHAKRLKKHGVDVCFIDGLHTHTQSLEDVSNSLNSLSASGVVVLHDCNPRTFSMAFPAKSYEDAKEKKLPGWTKEWCGDVWKTIVYLRSYRPDLHVFVLDLDYGLGVVTRGEPENMMTYSKKAIDEMTYEDLDKQRKQLLNLKEPGYLDVFLQKFRKDFVKGKNV